MKIGIKTFDNPEFLKKFTDKADFFEIMALETVNYDFLKEFDKPIVIHSQHQSFGVNCADKTKEERNMRSINFARKIADSVNAKKIILHPGDLNNENCSEKQAISFIKNINDKRIIIENIPVEDEIKRLCQTPEETKKFLKETQKGLCFDINHAMFVAQALNQDYLEIIKKFVKLKPVHYHFGGQIIKNSSLPRNKTQHLCLRDSDFDLKEVIELIPKDAEITLETTIDPEKTKDDVKIMREILNSLYSQGH